MNSRALLPFFLLVALSPAGCVVNRDPENPPSREEVSDAPLLPPSERDERLRKAVRLSEANKGGEALEVLYELVDDVPEDEQVRYLLARTLQEQGALRPARKELRKVVALNSKNALAFQRIGEIEQRLGRHRAAIEAFEAVAQLVPTTVDPLQRIAANYLIRGLYDDALSAIGRARERLVNLKREEPLVEYLAARIHQQRGDDRQATVAVRAFLKAAGEDPRFDRERKEFLGWLRSRELVLNGAETASMMSFARSTLQCVVDGPEEPGAIAKKAPPRLIAFDDSVVFITVFPPRGLGAPLFGRGREQSLLTSLARALARVIQSSGYRKELTRRAAVRITILSQGVEEVQLKVLKEDGLERLVAEPAVIPGRHGVLFDAGDIQPWMLPGDATAFQLGSLEKMLDAAAARLRLAPRSWVGRPVMRFEARSFVQVQPGARIVKLDGGEPLPRPVPDSSAVWESLLQAGDWLMRAQLPNGAFAPMYSAAEGRFGAPGAEALELVAIEDLVALTVRTEEFEGEAEGPIELKVDDGVLVVRGPKLDTAGLRAVMSDRFAHGGAIATIDSGVTAAGVSCQIRGASAESVRLMVSSELPSASVGAQLGAAWSLACLGRKAARPEPLQAAERTAVWAKRRLLPKPVEGGLKVRRRDLRPVIEAYGLLLLTELEDARRDRSPVADFTALREGLATTLAKRINAAGKLEGPGGAVTVSYGPVSCSLESLVLLALTRHAELTEAPQDLALALRVAKARLRETTIRPGAGFDPWLADSLERLHGRTRDPALGKAVTAIAIAASGLIRDPARDRRFAGGIGERGTIPGGMETAAGLRVLAAATSVCARDPGKTSTERANELRVATLSTAGFSLGLQVRPEHGWFLPGVVRALGGFRVGPFDARMRLEEQSQHVHGLLATLQIIREAGKGQ